MDTKEIEILRNQIFMQMVYDKLKKEHKVEMDKIINCFSVKKPLSEFEFISWEDIITFENFKKAVGIDVANEILRYFSNEDFTSLYEFMDLLKDEEVVSLSFVMETFSYPEAQNVEGFYLTDVIMDIIANKRTNNGVTLERNMP